MSTTFSRKVFLLSAVGIAAAPLGIQGHTRFAAGTGAGSKEAAIWQALIRYLSSTRHRIF
jgi:hypothetical protein